MDEGGREIKVLDLILLAPLGTWGKDVNVRKREIEVKEQE